MGWSPYDLPHLVEKSRAAYESVVQRLEEVKADDEVVGQLALSAATMGMEPPMTWLDGDMCEMVGDMWKQVPDWSPAACMPGPAGLIAFEKPLFTAPYESERGKVEVPVVAVCWGTNREGVVWVTGWCLSEKVPKEVAGDLLAEFRPGLEELIGVAVGVDSVVDGASPLVPDGEREEAQDFRDAGMALRSVVGAVWLVMSQPRVVMERDAPVVRVRRRRGAGGVVSRPLVRVSVTTLARPERAQGRGGAGRKATSRWWVRGHWRQQPWGKNRALRKPVWIAPHTAGAQDAEIDDRPSVQVWRRGDEPDGE